MYPRLIFAKHAVSVKKEINDGNAQNVDTIVTVIFHYEIFMSLAY